MKPKIRTSLNSLAVSLDDSLVHLRRLTRTLSGSGEELPAEIADMGAALAACQDSIEGLYEKVEATLLRKADDETPLTEAEIDQLLALNRRLRAVDPFLKLIADDVTPRLEAKLADPTDPMFDYEIEVLLDFILREDDPEYQDDDDNILTQRRDSLKRLETDLHADFTPPWCPAGLQAEPHCWRFHDLYDHEYGVESPRLSYRDCLRIGSIWIDVQVWQQYDFDLTARSAASN